MKRTIPLVFLVTIFTLYSVRFPIVSSSSTTPIWQVEVSSSGTIIESPALLDGQIYRIDVGYRFFYDSPNNLAADAQYYTNCSSDTWNWKYHFPAPDDHSFLQINGNDVDWGPFSKNHAYSIQFTGTGTSISFQIVDWVDDKHCNNRCHLEVKILDITPPANTILSPMNMTYYTMDVSLEYKVDEPTD